MTMRQAGSSTWDRGPAANSGRPRIWSRPLQTPSTPQNGPRPTREAVDMANTTAGVQEIWIPAWKFVLTRDRATYGGGSLTDTDIAWGDLDIKDSLIIRGVADRTSIAWKPGVVDAVFDLLGDHSHDDIVDAADY